MTPRQARLLATGIFVFGYFQLRLLRRQDHIVEMVKCISGAMNAIQEYMDVDYQAAVDDQFENIVEEEFPGGIDGGTT